MKRIFGLTITLILILFVFGSCTSISDLFIPGEKSGSEEVYKDESNYLNITNTYTLESLLLPVLQMSNYMASMDYFSQFLEYNDYIFADYLFTLLAMEADTYNPGQGTLLQGDAGSGLPTFKFEKSFLSTTDDKDTWWRYFMISAENELLLEILVNSFGVPSKIRFGNSESGQIFEIVPDIALDFERAITEVSPEELRASVADKINRSIKEGLAQRFVNPVIIAEELITTPAGEFMSVLVKDYQTESNITNYWLSPDVPGGILRISVTDNSGQESFVTELTNISKSLQPYYKDVTIVPYAPSFGSDQGENPLEPGYSEGSIDSPVLLYPGDEYFGSVGDDDISYYKFANNKRADLFIEVFGFEGYAELIYFGNDSKFENWATSSEGNSLNIEDYMVYPGENIYFSVNDKVDEYSVGEHYSILIKQNPILDTIGIMINGDIYDSAKELESGKSYSLTAGSGGLDYYKTTISQGSTLLIEIFNEPDSGSLVWFDTENGSYSGMSSEWGPDGKTIKIEGLKPDTVCYYYFTSDIDFLDPLQKLELKITELQ